MYFLLLVIPYKNIDPELQPYVDSYYDTVRPLCNEGYYFLQNKTTVTFGDLEFLGKGVVGICYSNTFHYRIFIDKDYWKFLPDHLKYSVIIHELSHCHMKLDHTEDALNYMNPSLEDLDKDFIHNQLVSNAKKYCWKWF